MRCVFRGVTYTNEKCLMQAVNEETGWAPTTHRASTKVFRDILDGDWTEHKDKDKSRFFAHKSGGKPPKGKGAVRTEHLCVFLTKTSDGGVEISALGQHSKHGKINQSKTYSLIWQSEADRAAHPKFFAFAVK